MKTNKRMSARRHDGTDARDGIAMASFVLLAAAWWILPLTASAQTAAVPAAVHRGQPPAAAQHGQPAQAAQASQAGGQAAGVRTGVAPLGEDTRSLLQAQAAGTQAGNPLPTLGATASVSWQRYLDSFRYPVPEWFKTHVDED